MLITRNQLSLCGCTAVAVTHVLKTNTPYTEQNHVFLLNFTLIYGELYAAGRSMDYNLTSKTYEWDYFVFPSHLSHRSGLNFTTALLLCEALAPSAGWNKKYLLFFCLTSVKHLLQAHTGNKAKVMEMKLHHSTVDEKQA